MEVLALSQVFRELLSLAVLYSSWVFTALPVRRLLPRRMKSEQKWVLALIFGPVLAAQVVHVWMYCFQGKWLLAAVITIPAASLLAFRAVRVREKKWRTLVSSLTRIDLGFGALLGCLAATLMLISWSRPPVGGDGVDYLMIARQLFERRDLSEYPFVNNVDRTGYYGPWFHPLGHPMLLLWSFLIQGHANWVGLAKFVSPYFHLLTCVLIYVSGLKRTVYSAVFAVLFFISPIFFNNSAIVHVDAVRLATFTGAILLLRFRFRSPQEWAFYGVFVGAALYTHSLNLLLLPLIGAYVLLQRDSNKIAWFITRTLPLALLPVFGRYWGNIRLIGSPIGDLRGAPVMNLKVLDWPGFIASQRSLEGIFQRFFRGVLSPISIRPLGQVGPLLAATLLCLFFATFVFRGQRRPRFRAWAPPAVVIPVLAFFLISLCSFASGSIEFIKNYRYTGGILPVLAILGVHTAVRLGRRLRAWAIVCLIAAVVATSHFYRVRRIEIRNSAKAVFSSAQGYTGGMRDDNHFMAHSNLNLASLLIAVKLVAEGAHGLILGTDISVIPFFARARFISDRDPRMIPVYLAKDSEDAASELRKLGVEYIADSRPIWPTKDRTFLGVLLQSPLSTVVIRSECCRLVRVSDALSTARGQVK